MLFRITYITIPCSRWYGSDLDVTRPSAVSKIVHMAGMTAHLDRILQNIRRALYQMMLLQNTLMACYALHKKVLSHIR